MPEPLMTTPPPAGPATTTADPFLSAAAAHVGLDPTAIAPAQADPAAPAAEVPAQSAPAAVLPFAVPEVKPTKPWYQLDPTPQPQGFVTQGDMAQAFEALRQTVDGQRAPDPELPYDPERVDPDFAALVEYEVQKAQAPVLQELQALRQEREHRLRQEQWQQQQQQQAIEARNRLGAFFADADAYEKESPGYKARLEGTMKALRQSFVGLGISQQEADAAAAQALLNVQAMAERAGVRPAVFHDHMLAQQTMGYMGSTQQQAAPVQQQAAPMQMPAVAMLPSGSPAPATQGFEAAVRNAATGDQLERIVRDPRWGGDLGQRYAEAMKIKTRQRMPA
jgi:hypothetical protein